MVGLYSWQTNWQPLIYFKLYLKVQIPAWQESERCEWLEPKGYFQKQQEHLQQKEIWARFSFFFNTFRSYTVCNGST